MEPKLKDLEQALRIAPDDGLGNLEAAIIAEALQRHPEQTRDILEWVFLQHRGFFRPSADAGLRLLSLDPDWTWPMLERLVLSENPDDRQIAIDILEESSDDRAPNLARPLLHDPLPTIRFDAALFLKDRYRDEVIASMEPLLTHHYSATREAARRLLNELGVSLEE